MSLNQKNKILLGIPVKFEEYLELIGDIIKGINFENLDNLKSKYSFYAEKLQEKGQLSKADLGFSMNLSRQYLKDRGYDDSYIENFYKERIEKLKNNLKNQGKLYGQTTKGSRIEFYKNKINPDTGNLYTEEEAKLKVKQIFNKVHNTLKQSDNWNSVKKSYANSTKVEYYLEKINPGTEKPYTREEAEIKIKNKQRKGALGKVKKKKEGKIYHKTTDIKFYLEKGFSYEESCNKVLERYQHYKKVSLTLERFKDLYGEDEGSRKFKLRQDKWLNSINSKSTEEKIDILSRKLLKFKRYSNESYKLFSLLELWLRSIGYTGDLLYGKNELALKDEDLIRIKFYDFCMVNEKILIEYHGHQWHSDPFTHEWSVDSHLNENQKLEKDLNDEYKKHLAIKNGYKLFYIYSEKDIESQLSFTKNEIINEIKNFKRTETILS